MNSNWRELPKKKIMVSISGIWRLLKKLKRRKK